MRRPDLIVAAFVISFVCPQYAAEAAQMHSFKPPANNVIRVAFVLTDSANVIDFAGPWEVFQDAAPGDTAPFRLYTVGETRDPVKLTGGLTVIPDYTFDDAPPPRLVVVGAQSGSPKMLAWLRKVNGDPYNDAVLSVCTGAFKLAAAGLLDGKRATTHHDFFDEFAKKYPRITLERGARYVENDRIFTAGGLTSGIDLALHIVALYYGEETAKKTAAYMEYHGAAR